MRCYRGYIRVCKTQTLYDSQYPLYRVRLQWSHHTRQSSTYDHVHREQSSTWWTLSENDRTPAVTSIATKYTQFRRDSSILDRLLDNRPPAREVKNIPSKELLAISVANSSINIVVVQHRAERRVGEDTPVYVSHFCQSSGDWGGILSSRSVDIVVAFQDDCSTAGSAGNTTCVNLDSLAGSET